MRPVRRPNPATFRAAQAFVGVGPTRDRIARFITQYVTYPLGNPDDTSVANVRGVPILIGANAGNWLTFFQNRGLVVDSVDNNSVDVYVPGDGTIQLRGMAPLHAASACRYAAFGHRISRSWEDKIALLSSYGTRVMDFLVNVEAQELAAVFQPDLKPVNDLGRQYILGTDAATGCPAGSPTGLTAYGCPVINQYEHTYDADFVSGKNTCGAVYVAGAAACPHSSPHAGLPAYSTGGSKKMSFDCDMRVNAYLAAHAALVKGWDVTPGRARRKMVDNVKPRPYKGTAKPDYPASYTDIAYVGTRSATPASRTGWKGYLQFLQEQYLGQAQDWIWGNCADPAAEAGPGSPYTEQDLNNRFVEHFFLDRAGTGGIGNRAEYQLRLDAIRAVPNLQVAMNIEPGVAAGWATGSGAGGTNWGELWQDIKDRNLFDRMYVVCCRTYIFDQPNYFEALR